MLNKLVNEHPWVFLTIPFIAALIPGSTPWLFSLGILLLAATIAICAAESGNGTSGGLGVFLIGGILTVDLLSAGVLAWLIH